jgi:hypothetical protein
VAGALVSEDSQHREERTAIKMLLTSNLTFPVLMRSPNHEMSRENEMQ